MHSVASDLGPHCLFICLSVPIIRVNTVYNFILKPVFKKQISSSSDFLVNKSLFGGQL